MRFVHAQDLPEARKRVALENIWRRIYIQDEYAFPYSFPKPKLTILRFAPAGHR